MPATDQDLLSPDFLRRLEQLELSSRRILAGRFKGERRSKRKGTSVEFADHRNYVVGDDLRFLDWNALIRLDRLFIKLFEEEEDLNLHLLVDNSASMGFGDPTKLLYAQRIVAALGFVGLSNLDRVRVWTYSDGLAESTGSLRGRAAAWRMIDNLRSLQPNGSGDLHGICKSLALRTSTGGLVVLVSDLMDKRGFEEALRYLVARRMEVYVIQVLAPEEVDPELTGDLKLVDVEDEDVAEITVSAPLLKRYKANLEAYLDRVRDYCARRGIAYLFTTTQQPFEQLVLNYLRRRGLLR